MRIILAGVGALIGLLLAAPVILVGVPFWIVACLTRALCRFLKPLVLDWPQLIEYHPAVGWKPKPNLDAYCQFGPGVFHIKTDSQGWPGKRSLDQSQVVVFGDSFAFGYGVNADAMFSEISPTLSVKAIGSPGYSMVHEVLWMQRLSSQLKGKLVVWFVYVGNDLYDNVIPNLYHYRMPFVRCSNGSERWEIVTRHISTKNWPFDVEQSVRRDEKLGGTFGTNRQSERIYSACEFLIQQGKDICGQAGARLVVMCIPWIIQLDKDSWQRTVCRFRDAHVLNPDLPEEKLRSICCKSEVPFVAARDYLGVPDHIPNEGHWNERGHQRIAEVLRLIYDNYMEGKARPPAVRVSSSRLARRVATHSQVDVSTSTKPA